MPTMASPALRSSSEDVALKSFFLGPRSENGPWLEAEVQRILRQWFTWRTALFPEDGEAISGDNLASPAFLERRERFARELDVLVERLKSEIPKHSPRYVGHMVSEQSLPALLGHLAAVLHNPNLVSAEVAPVAEVLEREAIGFLLEMVGLDPATGCGHFTSGGTVANIEALWRARFRYDHWLALGAWRRAHGETARSLFEDAHLGWERFRAALAERGLSEEDTRPYSLVINNPWGGARELERLYGRPFEGPVVLVPRNKHYSWHKAVSLLGLGEEAFWEVGLDARGTLDLEHLEARIESAHAADRPILMVVSVAGTTEMGEIDPVDRVQDLLDRLREERGIHVWHHVDAAYGGFFCAMLPDAGERGVLPENARRALHAIRRTDSLTIDPHKLGYVPYSCGALLVRDAQHDRVSSFAAPYLRADTHAQGLWSRTLEGSRPATGVAATWLTARTIGLGPDGYGRLLERSVRARRRLERLLAGVDGYAVAPGCDTNILCFCVGRPGEPVSATNRRSRAIQEGLAGGDAFYVSRTDLGRDAYRKLVEGMVDGWDGVWDEPSLCLVRVVLMNPFVSTGLTRVDYLARLAERIEELAASNVATAADALGR
ncbi:MAG TPA: pyridoxal-dependent decarboxylase [Thermoanaerobaculia bacterium]|nr:pyridoxal-dependent decarboxylase [Thermoanaerobaculia bacterium]